MLQYLSPSSFVIRKIVHFIYFQKFLQGSEDTSRESKELLRKCRGWKHLMFKDYAYVSIWVSIFVLVLVFKESQLFFYKQPGCLEARPRNWPTTKQHAKQLEASKFQARYFLFQLLIIFEHLNIKITCGARSVCNCKI